MRLSTIILPLCDNSGNALPDVHAALQGSLCDIFKGFTATPCKGGWIDPETGARYFDDSLSYAIACEDSAEVRSKVESIARLYGHLADQLAVFVTHCNGEVVFVNSARVPALV